MASYRRSSYGQRKMESSLATTGARAASYCVPIQPRPQGWRSGGKFQQKKRQIHTLTDLNRDEEETIVAWLRENEWVYNRKLTDNKDSQKKEKMWADKAEEMGKKVEIVKIWYRSLRTRYVKLTKKKKCGARAEEFSERDDWIMDRFSFLDKHIGKMKKRTPATKMENSSGSVGAGPSSANDVPLQSDNEDPEGWMVGSIDLPLPPSSSPKAGRDSRSDRARTSPATGEDAVAMTTPRPEHSLVLQMQERLLAMLQPRPTNERTAYADWMKSVVEGFDASVWRDFHYECSQLVYKYQLQNDQVLNGQKNQQSTSSSMVNSLMEEVNGH